MRFVRNYFSRLFQAPHPQTVTAIKFARIMPWVLPLAKAPWRHGKPPIKWELTQHKTPMGEYHRHLVVPKGHRINEGHYLAHSVLLQNHRLKCHIQDNAEILFQHGRGWFFC